MVDEIMPNYESERAAMSGLPSSWIGSAETVRNWVRLAQIDAGGRPGTSSVESVEVRRLKRAVAKSKRANAVLSAD